MSLNHETPSSDSVPNETVPLYTPQSPTRNTDTYGSNNDYRAPTSPRRGRERQLSIAEKADLYDEHSKAADELSNTLLALNTDDEEQNYRILRKSLNIPDTRTSSNGAVQKLEMIRQMSSMRSMTSTGRQQQLKSSLSLTSFDLGSPKKTTHIPADKKERSTLSKIGVMVLLVVVVIVIIASMLYLGVIEVGPPSQPVGKYKLIEAQDGPTFFDSYTFYEGPDSAGSNGYINYVSKEKAFQRGIAKILTEPVVVPPDHNDPPNNPIPPNHPNSSSPPPPPPPHRNLTTEEQPFIYMGTAPTPEGPRDSIRLEGKRRFNRGLFILNLQHMPAGCGTWPAFWLTDEANWPVNGEIDILEGVNFQTEAKTALHSTRICEMDDVPQGVKTGTWDTAIGIPDKDTGVPDMTMRFATDCFVYNPHQWLNQGCVAVDDNKGGIGEPLNEKGGGIYALEWDPVNRHIRSWVFTPHAKVPENLREALRTVNDPVGVRVNPDTSLWGLPYGYFAIGESTSCPANHFKNMRLVINLALCGSVAGNRYWMDCKDEAKKHPTCNEYIKSNPKELEEAYWKIRGVYIYEREWEKKWL